jgi:hypothetical protein
MSVSNNGSFVSYPASVQGDEIGEALVLTALGRTLATRYDGVVAEPLPPMLTRLLDALRTQNAGQNLHAR